MQSTATIAHCLSTNPQVSSIQSVLRLTEEEEQKIAREFVRIVNELRARQSGQNGAFCQPISVQNARKFLSARKFDLKRALMLYKAHEMIRMREGLIRFDLNSQPLRNELFSGKFTVLPTRDPNTGCCITLFSACKHNPINSTHQVTLQNIVLQLDVCISNQDAQNHGIMFIYNMINSKYANFDYELSQKILALLKGAYPAKLKKVLIITPPIWFKAPFKILRLFVREKLRDRVYMLNQSQLRKHLPAYCLPTELGGELQLDHERWINHCLDQIRANHEESVGLAPSTDDASSKSFMFNCDLIGENLCSFNPDQPEVELEEDDFRKAHSELDLAGLSEQLTGLCDKLTTNFEEDFGIKPVSENSIEEKLIYIDDEQPTKDAPIASQEAVSTSNTGVKSSVKHKPENIPIHLVQELIQNQEKTQLGPLADLSHANGNGHTAPNLNENDLETIFELQIQYLTENDLSLHLASDPGMHLNEFIQYLNSKGRRGLYDEYDSLRKRKNFALIFNNMERFREFCLKKDSRKGSSLTEEINSILDESIYLSDDSVEKSLFDVETLGHALIANYPGLFNLFAYKNSIKKENICKNRYSDVLCYDHSRVKLNLTSEESVEDSDGFEIIQTDYINANFVDGFEQKNAFISTQGPLNNTCVDFWEMCIANEVKVIVMTTRTMERQRIKCSQYWPLQLNSKLNFGYLTLINTDMQQFQDYVITKLTLKNNKTQLSYQITHMQFLSWPDYGVPATACAMLEFRQKVRDELKAAMIKEDWPETKSPPPIVVHCSAGIGRTGTFITLDISILRLETTGLINIQSTVEKIRSQRAHSIQTQDQYVFCYLALLEHCLQNKKNMLENVDLSGFEDSDSDQDE